MNQAEKICQKIEELIEIYTQSLSQYSEQQFSFKPSEEQWSLGQLYAHVLQTNHSFVKVVNYCLRQDKGQIGGDKTPPGVNIYSLGSFPNIKVKIPVKSLDQQPHPLPKSDYEKLFQDHFDEIKELLSSVETNSGDYKVIHKVFGFLNALEWYQMIEMHMRHHLRQKTELETLWVQNKS